MKTVFTMLKATNSYQLQHLNVAMGEASSLLHGLISVWLIFIDWQTPVYISIKVHISYQLYIGITIDMWPDIFKRISL